MTPEQARELVRRVFAAWPRPEPNRETLQLWVERFTRFEYPEAAKDAIDGLIDSNEFRPALALVREEYYRHRDKYLPRALPAPEPSEEERQAMAAQMRELTARLAAKLTLEERQEREAGLARTEQLIRHDPAWRDDPAWRLTTWDKELLPRRKLADRPAKDAELSTDGWWATIFKGRQAAAIWTRGAHPNAP